MLRRKFLSGLLAVLPLSLLSRTVCGSTKVPTLGGSYLSPNETQEFTITDQPTGGNSGWLPTPELSVEAPHKFVHFLRCPTSNALYYLNYMALDPHRVGFKLESVDLPINRKRSDGLHTYYFATCPTTGWRGEWELITEKVYDDPQLTALSASLRMNLADMHERLDALLAKPVLRVEGIPQRVTFPCLVNVTEF